MHIMVALQNMVLLPDLCAICARGFSALGARGRLCLQTVLWQAQIVCTVDSLQGNGGYGVIGLQHVRLDLHGEHYILVRRAPKLTASLSQSLGNKICERCFFAPPNLE